MQVQRQIDKLLAQRAAEWIEILKNGDERDRAEFVQWLRQSRLHVEQYLELTAIDREILKLGTLRGENVDALLARIVPNVVALPGAPERGSMTDPVAAPRPRRWRVAAALAASLVISLASIWYVAKERRNELSTAVGEQRTLTLSDGSVITLNALSTIKIEYSSAGRDVLLKEGEAAFRVAHEPSRPFIVHTPTADVRAVGTQFNVDEQPGGAVVSVLEGRVQVVPTVAVATDTQPQARKLTDVRAGEEARVGTSGVVSKRARPDVNKVLAWRERKLHFEETPLEDIIREFNRYGRSVQLRMEDIPAGTRRYGGIFEADDPESLALILSREPDLVIERRPGEIIIRKRE
jgi:transmembrane sensor